MMFLLFPLMTAWAEPTYRIEIEKHRLAPQDLQVTANEAFWLEVENKDNTSEEIESIAMNFEKIIGPRKTARIKVKKLSPGQYDIFGDFHMDTAKGTVTAVEGMPTDKVSK